jgi:hypothetical protein
MSTHATFYIYSQACDDIYGAQCSHVLNRFSLKGGVLMMVSQRMIMTGEKFDYKKLLA